MSGGYDDLLAGGALAFERPEHGVLEVRLNRPRSLNALTPAMNVALASLWGRVQADESVFVVLLTAAGRGFCAGADRGAGRQSENRAANARLALSRQRRIVRGMIECDKPVVSAVRGPAVGSGIALALMADIVVATPEARFMDGNVRLGVASGDYACLTWPLTAGMAKAKYHLLTGRELSGREAEAAGLVSLVAEDAVLEQVALEIARELADLDRNAVGDTKRALNGWLRMGYPVFDQSVAAAMLGIATRGE